MGPNQEDQTLKFALMLSWREGTSTLQAEIGNGGVPGHQIVFGLESCAKLLREQLEGDFRGSFNGSVRYE